MRRIRGSFWTAERDRRLQAFEAEGLTGAAIAERLGTTRSAVLGRSQRLRGLHLTYDAYKRQKQASRAAAEAKRREKERVTRAAMSRMKAEIAKGIPRNVAVMAALKAGATYQVVAEEIKVTRQRVQQLWKERGGRARYTSRRK